MNYRCAASCIEPNFPDPCRSDYENDTNARGCLSRAELPWHYDNADSSGLVCVHPVTSGAFQHVGDVTEIFFIFFLALLVG